MGIRLKKILSSFGLAVAFLVLVAALAWITDNEEKTVSASSHLEVANVLANSAPNRNKVRYYRLRQYFDVNFNNPSSNYINWPRRTEDSCGGGPPTFKTLPWLAQTSTTIHSGDFEGQTTPNYPSPRSGNFFDLAGNCAVRYVDGGTRTIASGGGGRGAWANPNMAGSWVSPTINDSGWPLAENTFSNGIGSSHFDCNAAGQGSQCPVIWGSNQRDVNDHSHHMFSRNFNNPGWSRDTRQGQPVWLTSSGTTLFRNTFNISGSLLNELINNDDIRVRFAGLADDWMRVFVNGEHIATTVRTADPRTTNFRDIRCDSNSCPFRQGTNVIAIQVVDKAVWQLASADAPNVAGLWYELQLLAPSAFSITTNVRNTAASQRVPTSLLVTPGQAYQLRTAATNGGPNTSSAITLQARRSGNTPASLLSGWSNYEWNVGTIPSGSSRTRDFAFTVAPNAPDGAEICFWSRASPRTHLNSGWINSPDAPDTFCVTVYRNFDMRAALTAPPDGNEYDELSGTFAISARLRNMHNPDNGMSTRGYPLVATLRITEGAAYIGPLVGENSNTKNRPPSAPGNTIEWNYTGGSNANQYFTLFHLTSDDDRITATTNVLPDLEITTRQRVCFEARVTPRHKPPSSPPFHSTERCIWIYPVSGPYVTTEGADVHAGAVEVGSQDACALPESVWPESNVRGRISPPRGSRGTYAVSATGGIVNFGSANSATSNLLKFGNDLPHGRYAAICRPDLTDTDYYERLGFDVVTWTGNMNALFAQLNNPGGGSIGNGKVVYISGNATIPASEITLNRGRYVTIIVDGDLRISGNINMQSGPYNNRRDIPSLALISAGDISIDRSVTNIAGYISSNGTIDTCGDVASITDPGQASQCGERLTIRGTVVANAIHFRRTAGDVRSGGGAASELIQFGPEMYLSPPPGLFGITNDIFVQTQIRERLPFF